MLISPYVTPGTACERDVIEAIGEAAYRRLRASPKFVVVYQNKNADVMPGFERVYSIPSHRFSPDASRPELNRHSFYDEAGFGFVVLYRRVAQQEAP